MTYARGVEPSGYPAAVPGTESTSAGSPADARDLGHLVTGGIGLDGRGIGHDGAVTNAVNPRLHEVPLDLAGAADHPARAIDAASLELYASPQGFAWRS